MPPNGSIFFGDFDAERFWRHAGRSRLPHLADIQSARVVVAMDEMQWVFCSSASDLVLTRQPFDPTYREYLLDAGFQFSSLHLWREGEDREATDENSSIADQILRDAAKARRDWKLGSAHPSPFAVGPFYEKLCETVFYVAPSTTEACVRRVNSKIFSHELAQELFGKPFGRIVRSAEDLSAVGRFMLDESEIVLKSEFGVSGKGSIRVPSPAVLERVVTYLKLQESNGKKTLLLVEPFLDREADFSCQLEINDRGEVSVLSTHTMLNSGFAFSGIRAAGRDLSEKLSAAGYFESMHSVGEALSKEGYRGPLCIDSMSLQDGTLVPVVEINARKSLGNVNCCIDALLSQWGCEGELTFLNLGLEALIGVEALLNAFDKRGLLFTKVSPHGILPVSANTLVVNQPSRPETEAPGGGVRGRLYFSAVASAELSVECIKKGVKECCTDMGMRILN